MGIEVRQKHLRKEVNEVDAEPETAMKYSLIQNKYKKILLQRFFKELLKRKHEKVSRRTAKNGDLFTYRYVRVK